MPGALHEISKKIGSLEARADERAQGQRDIWNELKELRKLIGDQYGEMNANLGALTRALDAIAARPDMEQRVRDLENSNNRRIGAAAIVGAFIGGAMEFGGSWLLSLWRGH